MKKLFILLLLCLLIVGSLFVIFKNKQTLQSNTQNNDTIIFPTKVIKNQQFTYIKSFIGTAEAIQSVTIVPYLSAFLKEIRIQSGEYVTRGDILFLLDDRIPLANLNQAKEAVQQTSAQLENAKIYYERMKNTDSKAISPTDLEQAKTEYNAAESTFQKALAAENQAQTLYNYTIIQAPISGWVGNITATVGEYLSPEVKTLATIIGFSPIRLVFSIPMSAYKNDYFSDDKASLQVVLANGKILEFKNFKVVHDNRVHKTTDSLSFFIDIPNNEKNLLPGGYIEVRFLYPKNGILVNKNWITLTPDGAEATLLKNGIIRKQKVEIGSPIGSQYWIKSGLNEGDIIITVPVSPFQVGQQAKGNPQ